MKYQSQKIALAYFSVAMALFLVQVTLGLVMGWIYVDGNFLTEILPFNIARTLHEQFDRLASAGLLWRSLLPHSRGVGTRNPFTHARLSAARDPRAGHSGRGDSSSISSKAISCWSGGPRILDKLKGLRQASSSQRSSSSSMSP